MKVISLTLIACFLFSLCAQLLINPKPIISKVEAGSSKFGGVTFDSSLPSSSHKSTVVSKASKVGFGWAREEYTYPVNDFAPYDEAYSKLKGQGLKILGLLTYPGGIGHGEWKAYVKSVVEHFPGVSAWEIMNEADNYLSPAEYTLFLKEAYTIIKDRGSATVVCSGVTARKEVYPFWDGIKAAGGWGSFDAVGLHIYHNGDPTKDSYENGNLNQAIQKVVNNISKNGGGKKIWITEFGYDSQKFGQDNQANWLVQGLGIINGFSQVERTFIFRMFDHGNGLGLLTSSFAEKPVYGAVKDFLAGGSAPAPVPAVTSATPVPVASPQASNTPTASSTPSSNPSSTPTPKIQADRKNTELRLDGEDVSIGEKYAIVVILKDAAGNLILDQKPSIILEGGQTELTDFVLVGNEWIAYITSNEVGTRTAKISLNGVELGSLKMNFIVNSPTPEISPTSEAITPEVKVSPFEKIKKNYLFVYSIGGLLIAGLSVGIFWFRRRKAL